MSARTNSENREQNRFKNRPTLIHDQCRGSKGARYHSGEKKEKGEMHLSWRWVEDRGDAGGVSKTKCSDCRFDWHFMLAHDYLGCLDGRLRGCHVGRGQQIVGPKNDNDGVLSISAHLVICDCE